jgi:hypothetical protein
MKRELPKHPEAVYLFKGWMGWRDLLGVPAICDSCGRDEPCSHTAKLPSTISGWRQWAPS